MPRLGLRRAPRLRSSPAMPLRTAMLYVKDLGRMTAFYRDGLGLTLLPGRSEPGWAEFDAGGGARLALHEVPAHVAAGLHLTSPPLPREGTPVKLIFEVAGLPDARRRLAALGAVVIDRPWGGVDATDPEGNVFGLAVA